MDDIATARPRGLRLAGLEGVVGLQVSIANALLVVKLEPLLEPLNLTAKQVAILWLVEANPGVTQTELSRFFAIERTTIHQFIRSLVKHGMLENEPSTTDRRAVRLLITERGSVALAEARDIVRRHEIEASAALSERERARLLELLAKLQQG